MTLSANDFIGLSKTGGHNKSEKMNLIFRLIRVDNEMFHDYPSDIRDDRVCVEIENGKIVKASIQ
jgi:hypothetical protein